MPRPAPAGKIRFRSSRPELPWKCPASGCVFDVVNGNPIVDLLARFSVRHSPAALLRLLGFDRPLVQVDAAARKAAALSDRRLQSVYMTRRTTLCAWVVLLRTRCTVDVVHGLVRAIRTADPLSHHLLLLVEPQAAQLTIACDAPDDRVRSLAVNPLQARASDIDALTELLPVADESDTARALRYSRTLDRSRVTTRFFRDVAASRDLIARSWSGLPAGATTERDALALLLLSRLLFIYFLQRRGLLAGDTQYLPELLRTFMRSQRRASFFSTTLDTLFFGVLNRRRERRTRRALRLGDLPYLNGGLFERQAIERDHPLLDMPDDVVERVVHDLLEKYRFTPAESDDDAGGGIDPEMLGRIFEGLMPGDRRARTGTFYTPADVVQRVVIETLTSHLADATGVPRECVASLFASGSQTSESALVAHADGDTRARAALEQVSHTAASLRVLDPACGSGAFLLGSLSALTPLVQYTLQPGGRCSGARPEAAAARRAIVANCLYGVDLLDDAALICSLRLWLSLVPECETVADVPPLPNLDRRIRQGDALIDPLDISASTPARLTPLVRSLEPVAAAYLGAGPETRGRLRRELVQLERRLARCWLDTLQHTVAVESRELDARAQDRDLFGEPTRLAAQAVRALPTLRRRISELNAFRDDVASHRSLPFFSFRVHFAEAADGFDIVLSNPPWIRSHNWPPTVRESLRERYSVCAEAGWPHAAELAGTTRAAGAQVDLALLFLERGVRLLAPGGTLGMLLPAKLVRSLFAGGARALLLRSMQLICIEDHSLDHRAVFDADAFTAVVIARRPRANSGCEPATEPRTQPVTEPRTQPVTEPRTQLSAEPSTQPVVRVRMTRPGRDELRFELPAAGLPVRAGDHYAPWLLAPPACAAALRTMQRNAPAIGEHGLPVRRGAMTGANDVLLVRDVEPKIGDLARIRTDGWYRANDNAARRSFSALVEGSVLRPALRGTDVQRWNAEPGRHVIWVDETSPRRLVRFMSRHRARLGTSHGPPGALQRINEYTFGHKVVWSDLAADLRAAAVQPRTRSAAGCTLPIVPLNTVYFLATSSHEESLLLAAYLNSLPLRTFARAIAERAKDAHFRFFAWTIATLPLPRDWRDGPGARELMALSATAHERGTLSPGEERRLDDIVARTYGLGSDEIASIAAFDRWLS